MAKFKGNARSKSKPRVSASLQAARQARQQAFVLTPELRQTIFDSMKDSSLWGEMVQECGPQEAEAVLWALVDELGEPASSEEFPPSGI